jgi:hypothetical protein
LFLRYKVQTERLYRRAIEDFERLKALRHELPNEPISEAQSEANLTTYDPLPTDPIPPPDSVLTPPPPTPAGPPAQARWRDPQTDNHASNDHSGGPRPEGGLPPPL